jgi:hypothetical protein
MSGWLTAYARELGHELPQRVVVPGYPKGDAWAPPDEPPCPTFLDVEELAGRGLLVFPCKGGAKEPATQHGFQDASRDPYRLERWWTDHSRFNVGIATGAKSGVVVVDLDGELGIANYAQYVTAGLPPTWCALTAGGVHLYFAHPGAELGNTQHRLGRNIDTRGDGGYVVAPPSLLACGVPYRWLLAPWQLEEPAPLPRKVLEAWRPERRSAPSRFEVRRSFEPGQDGDSRALAMLDRWMQEIAGAGKGMRDALLAKYAYAAGARVREGRLIRSAAERALLGAISAWGPISNRDQSKIEKGITAGIVGKG